MSSTTASVSSRTRSRVPLGATSARTPSANAVSVEIAAPQPFPPPLITTNRTAAIAIPPSAATTGTTRLRRSRSWPITSSRLASSPTTRKNSVIRPWLTHSRRFSSSSWSPSRIASWVDHTDSYESDHGEFAHTSAATAATSSAIAPPVSVRRKSRSGAPRLRAHAVVPRRRSPPPFLASLSAPPRASRPAPRPIRGRGRRLPPSPRGRPCSASGPGTRGTRSPLPTCSAACSCGAWWPRGRCGPGRRRGSAAPPASRCGSRSSSPRRG